MDIVNYIDIEKEFNSMDGWKDVNQITDFNFVDLFSGAGGLSCGLVMSGMNPIASVEIMPEAVETYKYNFSRIPNFDESSVESRDIRLESTKEGLYKSLEGKHIHLITGGFPCQGFSIAGNRVVTDERNSLYLDMLEIVKNIQPDYVLMENVEGLRSMLDGAIERKIISDFNSIGYDINVTLLNSADYGVAQLRKRVIFIGNRIKAINYHPKPILDKENYIPIKQVLSQFLDSGEDKSINHIFTKHSEDILDKIRNTPVGKSMYDKYSDSWRKLDWDKPSCTVKENHGGVNLHPIKNRAMTPRELATLQSFPLDFIFKGSKKWQLVQIGNAVPCLLGKAIGLAILKSHKEKQGKSSTKKQNGQRVFKNYRKNFKKVTW